MGMQGKVVLVTGATGGIGKVAARELARKGAEVVLVGRDATKARATVGELKQATGNERISALIGDLARPAEVRRVAQEFKRGHERLDVLLNNAGALFDSRELTDDGLEKTFALNHLAYFVLTNELLELLKKSAPSRVVSVSSDAHRAGKLDFSDLQGAKRYTRFGAYGRSKLANILFTRELARRLEGTGVTANCLHPGVVGTNFGQGGGGFLAKAIKLVQPLMLTPDQGADTAIWLASSPDVEGLSGKYFTRRKERKPSGAALNDADARRLWDESEKIVAGVLG